MSPRPLVVLAALIALLALVGLRPVPPAGPGAVEAMHRELFAALDAGDAQRAATFVAPAPDVGKDGLGREPWVAFPGASNALWTASGVADARAALERFARESRSGDAAWTTRIVRSQADCHSAELSFAVIEVERARTDAKAAARQRFLWTSLVRYVDGHWRIFHAHVSPLQSAER